MKYSITNYNINIIYIFSLKNVTEFVRELIIECEWVYIYFKGFVFIYYRYCKMTRYERGECGSGLYISGPKFIFKCAFAMV